MYIPNGHKISQMSVKYSNGHKIHISTFPNLRQSKICPEWDFWFEKKPSGNPASNLVRVLAHSMYVGTLDSFLSPRNMKEGVFLEKGS
jgi:hypothetical protein